MSAVSGTSSSNSTNPSSYTDDVSSRVVQKSLGQNDFLKLLTTQMTNQDPMNPTSDTDQIAQLAQFSSLQSMNSLLTNSQLQGATAMMGKKVTIADTAGTITGTVDSAQLDSGKVYVTVNGTQYPYSEITKIESAPVATTSANQPASTATGS